MKTTHLTLTLVLAALIFGCATHHTVLLREPTTVEVACGECQFGMEGQGCDLAVRIQGRTYFMDGVSPEALGDPHAATGICECIREARVTGQVRNGRFVATSFRWLPVASKPAASPAAAPHGT